MTHAILVTNLTKQFKADAPAAVDDISFAIPHGALVGLLGGNGAGKTTSLSMLLGILIPTRGSIQILQTDILQNRHAVLGRMNFSSPYVDLPQRLTARENLIVFSHLYNVKNAKDRITELARELDITNQLDRIYGGLSAGQKTRVLLAKSLLNRPDILLLDEPTASLDPDTADWIRQYIKRYQQETGATILMASHNMQEVERLCDSVIMMQAGKIVEQDTPQALITRYGHADMEEVFLTIARKTQP